MPEQSLKDKAPAIAAAACAAVTVTWLASFAGVSGTLAGVAASSVVSGIAVSLYERWIRRAHSSLATRLKAHGKPDPWERYYRPAAAARRFDIPWKRAAVLGGCALVISLGSVLAAEALAHKPVAAIVTGSSGHGCSVCGGTVTPQPPVTPVPVLTTTPSPSPTLTTTPSPSPSPAPTTPSPSPSPSPTLSPTPVPAATFSPSPSP